MKNLLTLLALLLAQPAFGQDQPVAEAAAAPELARYVQFKTSAGDFVIELLREQAPVSTANFAQYVRDGFYDGTVFHRVINGFVIQGGGFTTDLVKKPTREPIVNEADNMLPNEPGTLAMARTAHPHSATSQFYVNVADNVALNHTGKTNSRAWGYAVFARVISGMEVIEAIRSVPTGAGGQFGRDVPLTPIVVEAASVIDGPAGDGAAVNSSGTATQP